jgi:hypothetical protein
VTEKDQRKHDSDDVATTMATLIAPLSSDQIEKLTIEAIHEHRTLLAKAEAAFESLESAEAAKAGTAGELREAYTRTMLAARAQQMVLATLVERLGFIPRVPSA